MPATRITSQDVKDATLTDADVAAANIDGTAATPSMRTLGTGAQQAAAGNHGPHGTPGAQGPPGADGEDGEPGPPGPAGATGPAGSTGATGPSGAAGPMGPPGEDGADGVDGSPGPPGATGATGATGSTGPAGAAGPAGADGLDGEDGLPGPPGPAGVTGSIGPTGATGPSGPQGAPGIDGEDGEPGVAGAAGPAGPTGSTGPAGANGANGLMGPPGLDGEDGEQGLPGPRGLPEYVLDELTQLVPQPQLAFMGAGVKAQVSSPRTEVIVGAYYDAIVDHNDTNAVGKGNIYDTLAAAVADGARSVFVRSPNDAADVTIAGGDNVSRIIGSTAPDAAFTVNLICNKTAVVFEQLLFTDKTLTLGGARCVVFACRFTGAVVAPSALVNAADASKNIEATAAATPINIKITGHGYTTGDQIVVASQTGSTNANGKWVITVVDANNFTLNGSINNGAITATGTATKQGIAASTLSIPYDGGAGGNLPTRGIGRIDDEIISWTAGGGAASGTLTVPAGSGTGRGKMDSASLPTPFPVSHGDNTPIYGLYNAAVIVTGADCELVENTFLTLTGANTHCVLIMSTADRTKVTANRFLVNSCFSGVALAPENLTTNNPQGCQVTANTFDQNSFSDSHILSLMRDSQNDTLGDIAGFALSGNLIRNFEGLVVRLHARSGWNITGNVIDATTIHTRTNLVNRPTTATNIVNSTNASPINIQATAHGLVSGDTVTVAGHTTNTAANGVWVVTRVDANNVTLNGSTGNGVGGATGTIVKHGLGSADMTIDYDTTAGNGTPAPSGVLLIESERVFYGSYSGTQFLNCIRGYNGTTASTHPDNTTITCQSQRALQNRYGSTGATSIWAVLCSGNSFSNMKVFVDTIDAFGGATRIQFADNSFFNINIGYLGSGYAFSGNTVAGGITFDFRSLTNQSVVGGFFSGTVVNLATDTFFLVAGAPTGLATGFYLPTGKHFGLGRVAGDATDIAIPMTNKTGSSSVATHVVIVNTALANSFKESTLVGGADPLVVGVCVQGGIADGSPALIAVGGVVSVLCTGTIAVGDNLVTDVTAGVAKASAAPAVSTRFAKALSAGTFGAGTGTVTAVLMPG